MRYLKQNADSYVTVGPFLDKTDGFTLEDGFTVTNISYLWVQETQDSSDTHTTGTCDATAANDWGLAAVGHGGMYTLKIPDSVINYVGSGVLTMWDADECLPVWHEFMVVPANVWDSMMGTDLLDTNQAQLLGTAPTEGGAGRLAAGLTKLFDVATPVLTAASVNQTGDSYAIVNGDHGLVSIQDDVDEILTRIPDATAGAAGGLPTVAAGGLKLQQTVDLTAGQSIAVSGTVVLDATQSNYAPAKPGDKMDLIDDPNATATAAIKGDLANLTVDVRKVNNVTLTGNGSAGNPWGPA